MQEPSAFWYVSALALVASVVEYVSFPHVIFPNSARLAAAGSWVAGEHQELQNRVPGLLFVHVVHFPVHLRDMQLQRLLRTGETKPSPQH